MKRTFWMVTLLSIIISFFPVSTSSINAQGCVDTTLFSFNNTVINAGDPYLEIRKDYILQAGDEIYADLSLQRVPDATSSPVPYEGFLQMITNRTGDLEILIDEQGQVYFSTPDTNYYPYPYDGSGEATISTDINGYAETVTISNQVIHTVPVTDTYYAWIYVYSGILNGTIYIRSCGTPPTTPPNKPLVASAVCNGEDLVISISGDFNFSYSITGTGVGLPLPRQLSEGVWITAGFTTVLHGPEKWDNLTITESWGDYESINLGQFKCLPADTPNPIAPQHRSRLTDNTPDFLWQGISQANRYRVFVFDNPDPAFRLIDIRQNTVGAENTLTLATPLPTGRFFWRVRGRVNSIWSRWSIRFTLFIDPPLSLDSNLIQPSLNSLPPATPMPTISMPGESLPQPPNSR